MKNSEARIMTEEELEKKAEEYLNEFKFNKDCSKCWHRNHSECSNKQDEECLLERVNYSLPTPQQAYKDGYKQGQKENEKLKAQIEKMKGCENCKHLKGKCAEQLASFRCENKNDWELAE